MKKRFKVIDPNLPNWLYGKVFEMRGWSAILGDFPTMYDVEIEMHGVITTRSFHISQLKEV